VKRAQSPSLREQRRALARALFPKGILHPASKYDATTRTQVLTMYRQFEPIKAIMATTGCSRDTVNRYVREADLPRRKRGKRHDTDRWKPGYEMVNGKPTYTGG
jgi:DNA invertase Pin-like site-specific DNA recombinase